MSWVYGVIHEAGKLVKNIRSLILSKETKQLPFMWTAVSVQPDLERHASRLTAEGNKQ